MHPAAHDWVAEHATHGRTLEIGGRDINGTVRDLFGSDYTAIDITDGPGVDIVADVCDFQAEPFDVIVCCEVLEHTDKPILEAAHRLLRDGGTLILTAAGPGREPHSATDGGPLRDGEHYRNIEPDWLRTQLAGWACAHIDVAWTDIRAVAVK